MKDRFQKLKQKWVEDTAHMSNPRERSMHWAYQRIIGMGEPAVTLMLEDMEENGPHHWFWALQTITGADPVDEEDRGRVPVMAETWIEWGRENGYL